MADKGRTVEQRMARLASGAQGVVARRELLAVGITRAEIEHRLATGALIPEYRGVYRVGHAAPSVEARYTAAVKACGPRAVLSGMAAAYLLGLVKRPPAVPEVTAPTERRVPGIRARRCRRLDRRDTMRFKGIPVTTPARTLVDVAAELGAGELARACHEAHVRFGTTPADVEAVLARRPTAPGAGKLRRILRGDDPVLLSALERAFLRLLRVHDLPLPETNRPVGAHYVDCRWPAHRLTVELDGYRYHHTRHAWEQDRERERAARARGDEFRRYTWADVHEHAEATAAEIARLRGRG